MHRDERERLERTARDLLATAIGFAVLGLNRAQVERRRLGIPLGCDRDRRGGTRRTTADRA